ncbi:MAG TPA: MBL fold metallo-hydrolase [Stellaceae bacterium]|jgi:glyoxylase-like metal-dependent hydrolase (beta-lactamase superfamily II)/rhodanese-related sulfurtransferase|nr:MBL fold metallo-hydrolase [Stellaceae bacterium]
MLVFRQLFDPPSSTYTYLLADGGSGAAVIIDPVFEQVRRDAALIEELGLRLVYALETHVHADHVTGGWLLKRRTGCRIALAANSGADGADRYLVQDDVVAFGDRNLQVRQTPGHTNGCLTYVLDDRTMAFTGDCLLVRGTGRTDFQQGDPDAMYRSIHQQIFTLPDSCLLYPAHDYRGLTVTSVREERRFNPRLGGEIGEGDFTGYMKNLRLAHPKKLDVAVPANLKCGRPETGIGLTAEPNWAALRYSFAGIWEIDPHGLEEHAPAVQILDVREPEEFIGPLGHIRGAILIPLGELAERAGQLARDRPIVAVCRAGSRSAQATVILREAGFGNVANLSGGMLRWRAEGHAVEGGSA